MSRAVKAKEFHPMRGHVEEGIIVLFSDGSKAMVKSTMRGWKLVDDRGADLSDEVCSAVELTVLIAKRDAV